MCQDVHFRDGKTYVKLEGELEEVIDGGARLRIDFEDGQELTLAPKPDTSFYVGGRKTPVGELTKGMELNFYIPEDRFQAEFAGGSGGAPFIIVPFVLPTTGIASASPSSSAANRADPVMLVLMPAARQKPPEMLGNGCWATLYGQERFAGDSLTLVGPIDMQRMIGPFGFDWDQKLRSIKTGPRAKVTLYDDEAYREKSAKLDPGASVAQIDGRLGLFEEVESMKVSCTQAA